MHCSGNAVDGHPSAGIDLFHQNPVHIVPEIVLDEQISEPEELVVRAKRVRVAIPHERVVVVDFQQVLIEFVGRGEVLAADGELVLGDIDKLVYSSSLFP